MHCLIVSDVPGDDASIVSSGPCSPDPLTARALVAALRQTNVWPRLPERAREHLAAVERGAAAETPKATDPAFRAVTTRTIVDNGHALRAAADAARAAGIQEVTIAPDTLVGEAAICGVRLASELIARAARARRMKAQAGEGGSGPQRISRCIIWGGETTVTGAGRPDAAGNARGGRNQELALAAARSLGDAGDRAASITLLAAGTDGRDGPTDAAGAVVDGSTWSAIRAAGRDPESDLARHDAYHALDAAAALVRSGLTGTNVMDVVIGLTL